MPIKVSRDIDDFRISFIRMTAESSPQACADKLNHELTLYGIPPQFPVEVPDVEETAPEAAPEVWSHT